ncbi:hypothetical protein BD310DRAFT_982755 [Dichomitus squalens]|uniref:Zn(2)-C6 fungal-type domain-containing protein n=1 Tax=Dichomitus squalens TaxID=114155 RepID=A0A4Q9PE69_9APHY|nr:hypothetical protein BD310DRAFT_982755 [Dichomitus squalens]
MKSLSHPANIPGLFQFPPSLEPDLAPFDQRTPHPLTAPRRPPPSASSSASTSAMRLDHNLAFPPREMPSYAVSPGDHYSHRAAFLQPTLDMHASSFASSSLTPPFPREYVHADRATGAYPPQHHWNPSPAPHPGAHALQPHPPFDNDVKIEDGVDGQTEMWHPESSQMAYGAQQCYSYEAVDEQMHDCKEECADEGYSMQYPQQVSDHSQSWESTMDAPHAQPPYLSIDIPDYSIQYEDNMFIESPMSAPEMHTYPEASIHRALPALTVATRSYTLEGAITPISPKPKPRALTSPAPHMKRRTDSPPPMGFLRPPTPPFSRSCSSPSTPQSSVASGSGSSSGSAAQPSPPTDPAPSPAQQQQQQLLQKRPRGRPRKNPAPPRAPSPPPVVDYPFPQFPAPLAGVPSASASTSAIPPPAPTMTIAAGQAMFKLNMALGEGEGEGEGKEPEKKKPIMACLFCRERKIACGPPPPGGPQRCNQCTRRGLVCEYPKESRRGQHKRGARAARVEALASASASASAAVAASSSASASHTSIKPKPKPKQKQKADTASAATSGTREAAQVPSSPLTPLPSPLPQSAALPCSYASSSASSSTSTASSFASSSVSSFASPGTPPAPPSAPGPGERKSRADKVAAKGKERSRSRSLVTAGTGPSAVDMAAMRRVAQKREQQKRRAADGVVPSGSGSGPRAGGEESVGDRGGGGRLGLGLGLGRGSQGGRQGVDVDMRFGHAPAAYVGHQMAMVGMQVMR